MVISTQKSVCSTQMRQFNAKKTSVQHTRQFRKKCQFNTFVSSISKTVSSTQKPSAQYTHQVITKKPSVQDQKRSVQHIDGVEQTPFLCCTYGYFVLNWRFFCVELTGCLNWRFFFWWTDAFCVLNWKISGAEKVWSLCWTKGSLWNWGVLDSQL